MNITFITGSSRKFQEIDAIVASSSVSLVQLTVDLTQIQELDARKIIEAKLHEAFKHTTGPCMVEDMSLYLDALGGLPGPLIKWFLSSLGDTGLADIAAKLGDTKATAKTIIGYAESKDAVHFFEGEVVGRVVAPRVKEGFGWDLIFVPEGYRKTFAEMTQEEKNKISMRGAAAKKLREFLQNKI